MTIGSDRNDGHGRCSTFVPLLCLGVFLICWTVLAIAPWDRDAWLLENLLTLGALPIVVATYRRFRFTNRSYVQATIFLCLHTLGSHYTYSRTPFGDWAQAAFDLERNHFDRFVHFSFGLLMLAPTRELFFRAPAAMSDARQRVISIALIVAWGTGYEIVEWLTAILADPEAGIAFLGTQGDPWDAQQDLLAACFGAGIAAALEAGGQRLRATQRSSRRDGSIRNKIDISSRA